MYAKSLQLPCPPPGDLPDPGVEHTSFTSPALADTFLTTSTAWETHLKTLCCVKCQIPKDKSCMTPLLQDPEGGQIHRNRRIVVTRG